jgi:GNAT superfamily N-acetyltransferase
LTLRIRPARREDAAAMHRCLAALSAQDGAPHRAAPEDYLRHGFGQTRLFQCVIVEEAGAVIGLAVFFPTFSTQRGRPGVYIQDLWLEPAGAPRGLGRRLSPRCAPRPPDGAPSTSR